MASRKIEDLHPVVKSKIEQWVDNCKYRNVDVLVYCTYRNHHEQDELYKLGRTVVNPTGKSSKKPFGNIVTNAEGGQSFHQFRVAVDAVPTLSGKPLWDDTKQYAIMGEEAKKLGIEWAGNWKTFKEKAHFQYTGGLSLKDLQGGKLPA